VFSSHGYGEIRTPTLESTELFARSVGETTDIVHKEMYTFLDRKGRSLTLRPENTAGVVRALVERGIQDVPKPVRLWYTGSQFRYEQPQAGRFREFRQIGAELVGAPSPEADAEMIGMLFVFLRRLGFVRLSVRLNCVPTGAARQAFSDALREHLRPHADALGSEEGRRLEENPLRLFDSKNPRVKELLMGAPTSLEFLDDRARAHHEEVKRLLAYGGIDFTEDPSIVRGLDYYTLTVFEVVSESLGAQNALLGGGRYDELFAELGGPALSAVGFAIGEDRLVSILPEDPRRMHEIVVVVPESHGQFQYALAVANEMRRLRPAAVVETDFSGKGLKRGLARASQILADPEKYPFRASAVRAVLLGGNEDKNHTVTIRDLANHVQETVSREDLPALLERWESS
jgi:histidyl-tRNA synthetase